MRGSALLPGYPCGCGRQSRSSNCAISSARRAASNVSGRRTNSLGSRMRSRFILIAPPALPPILASSEVTFMRVRRSRIEEEETPEVIRSHRVRSDSAWPRSRRHRRRMPRCSTSRISTTTAPAVCARRSSTRMGGGRRRDHVPGRALRNDHAHDRSALHHRLRRRSGSGRRGDHGQRQQLLARVLHVQRQAELDVRIAGLTITQGRLRSVQVSSTSTRTSFSMASRSRENNSVGDGAGLWADGFAMDLTITNSTISGNISGGNGGGIYIEDTGGPLLIEDSVISGNQAGEAAAGSISTIRTTTSSFATRRSPAIRRPTALAAAYTCTASTPAA